MDMSYREHDIAVSSSTYRDHFMQFTKDVAIEMTESFDTDSDKVSYVVDWYMGRYSGTG